MSTSTALVTLDDMNPKQALNLHLEAKERGRGELGKFIKHETAHTPNQYYYRLRKKGVMPLKAHNGGTQNIVSFKTAYKEPVAPEVKDLEEKLRQLELQLHNLSVTPAKRAMAVLSSAIDEIEYRSRSFLATIVAKNCASLSVKQEKWLADLESKYL
jgi:hypothetical protein